MYPLLVSLVSFLQIEGVPSSPFLHQLPALLVDCERDVDVEGDMVHGEAVANMVRGLTVNTRWRGYTVRGGLMVDTHKGIVGVPRGGGKHGTRVTHAALQHTSSRILRRPVLLPARASLLNGRLQPPHPFATDPVRPSPN